MSVDATGFELINTFAFILCVTFCAYVLSIMIVYLRRKPASAGDPDEFDWHLIVPCRDEAAVIGETVRHLVDTFDSATIWCVDDGSVDGTREILETFSGLDRVRILCRTPPKARQGKGAALNEAWAAIRSAARNDAAAGKLIVGVIDADSRLDVECFAKLAGSQYFGDSTVGAVQVEVRMVQCGSTRSAAVSHSRWGRMLIRLQDLEFRAPIAAMQELRRRTGSVGMGGNGQFTRLSVLNEIAESYGTPWHGALLEDFELGLHVLLVGSRTEYCPEAWVEQEALVTARHLLRQRSRWAQGSMQCARYFPAIMRSRHVRNSAAVEITYFLAAPWFQLVGTVTYTACLGVLVYYIRNTSDGAAGWWTRGGWGVIPLIVIFGILPFAVWGIAYRVRCAQSISRSTAIGIGFCHWVYSYVQCVAVWMAFVRLLRAKSDWQKTARVGTTVPPARLQSSAPG
ncbi:glycosyltransferase family 2 protein [Solwaraspora sp. WMMD406]|uniref:glycosyltransferase family 2 protein n=1 Tax=Solwaraspora sp. WMMD406 TaxID=3016095 RepID=UPI0024178E5F|nr:glycosyltransferase family 2 protein [Solwaraspora sp. WMMD406]MDG4767030.1 glycosyltransferase family 2 protein [Solwaraspora sp. WMMD406]